MESILVDRDDPQGREGGKERRSVERFRRKNLLLYATYATVMHWLEYYLV